MIICVCKAVSDRHIRAAVNEGASSLREITRELKVGTCCGKCLPEAKAQLMACLAQCSESATGALFGSPAKHFAV